MSDLPSYSDYKESGVEWLGEIPSHWVQMSLKYSLAIPITDGPHETPEILTEGVPFISAEAVKNDKLDFHKKRGYISEEDDLKFSKKYKPKYGDVYMVKSGATTGNVARVETYERFNIWSPLAVMRPNQKHITTDYLFYTLKSEYFNNFVKTKWNMGTQQNIGMGILANIPTIIPPLEEQKAITRYLDKKLAQIDTLITKQQALLEKLAEQRIALISNAVTKGLNPDVEMKESGVEWLGKIPSHWTIKRLKFMAKIKNGCDYKHVLADVGYPVIGSGGAFAYSDSYLYNGESVLLGRKGTIDKPLYVNGAFWTVDTMYYTEIFNNISAKYLYYCTLTVDFWKYATQTALPSMTQTTLSNLLFSVPNYLEQQAIASYLDNKMNQIERIELSHIECINRLKEYRSALITQAVTGKIDVRNLAN